MYVDTAAQSRQMIVMSFVQISSRNESEDECADRIYCTSAHSEFAVTRDFDIFTCSHGTIDQ